MSTVSIPKTMKGDLDTLKIISREPYYSVIGRLISTQKSKQLLKKKR